VGQPNSPGQNLLEDTLRHDARSPSPLQVSVTPEGQPDLPMLNDAQDKSDEANKFAGDAMEVDRNYLFDHFLDDMLDNFHHSNPYFGIDDLDGEVDGDLNDEPYNKNFGLPDREDAQEVDQPRFQLPQDEDLERELEQA
jgi:hypothetical protein